MEKQPKKYPQLILGIGAIMGWFAVLLQFYLIIINKVASVLETIIRFFSFYTILTNILVAMCFTFLWLKPKSRWGLFFAQPKTLTAITVYICIVGLVYNTILRFLWNPTGLQFLTDELLHSVIPILFILFWIKFVPKNQLKWGDFWPWLIYPLVYLLYILSRGAFVEYYPYPFMDVNILGYNKVLLNSMFLCIVFLFISLLFVAIAKMISRKSL